MSNQLKVVNIAPHIEWAQSKQGLTEQDVKLMGLRPVEPEQTFALLGFGLSSLSVLIPYPHEEFYRVRILGQLSQGGGKYLSPRNSGHAPPYLSPTKSLDEWNEIRADVRETVIITEGEVKAYWGCKTGQTVVGIGGVDMAERLFDGRWEWKGRKVRVCFDHDEGQEGGAYKANVHNSLGRLCSRLAAVGAEVGVLHIGRAIEDRSKKWGLDDYLRAGGKWDRLLLTETAPEEWCEQLAGLLDDCRYVTGTNHTHIFSMRDGTRKTPADFHDTHIDKVRLVMTTKKDGSVFPKPVQVSRQWVEHSKRVTAKGYTLDPSKPFGDIPIVGDPEGRVNLNLWRGYPSWDSITPNTAILTDWQRFMEGLFGEHWKWVGLWTAHMLNRPGERSNQAVMVLTRVQGIGKSLFGDIIRDLTGDHGLECSSARMFTNFNSEMEGKAFVMVNELDVKFSSKEGQLNDLLTSEVVTVEQKGKDAIQLPDLRRWYFTTNTSSPCRLSKGQRRVLVISPPRTKEDTRGEWGEFVREVVAKWRKSNECKAAIRFWFDALWAEHGEGWDSTAPVPVTEAAEQAAEASMTKSEQLVEAMVDYIQDECEGGWSAVSPLFKKGNAKVWGEISAEVNARGGHPMEKSIKRTGKALVYTVYAFDPELVGREAKGGGKGHVATKLDTGKVEAAAKALEVRFGKEMLALGMGAYD